MVLPKRLLTIGLAVALSGCMLNADAPLSSRSTDALDMIPAGADMVAFADASNMVEHFDALAELDPSTEFNEAWDHIQDALDQLGLDPREDIDYVVGYAGEEEEPVVIAVGDFDADRFDDFLARHDEDIRRQDAEGMSAWTLGAGGPALGISTDGSRLLAGRSLERIQAALDTRGGTPIAAIGGRAMTMDAWLVVRELPEAGTMDDDMPEQIAMLSRAVSSLALGSSLTADEAAGVLVLHPREGVAADDLASLVRGALGALRMQDIPEDARKQLEEVDVKREGDAVVVSGSVARDFLETFARQ